MRRHRNEVTIELRKVSASVHQLLIFLQCFGIFAEYFSMNFAVWPQTCIEKLCICRL